MTAHRHDPVQDREAWQAALDALRSTKEEFLLYIAGQVDEKKEADDERQ